MDRRSLSVAKPAPKSAPKSLVLSVAKTLAKSAPKSVVWSAPLSSSIFAEKSAVRSAAMSSEMSESNKFRGWFAGQEPWPRAVPSLGAAA